MDRAPDPSDAIVVHFYRAVVGHMDVWRQRMDATTNWAAATTAVMVTFTFGSVASPHFILLLSVAFNGVFLLMESRRYQIFDLWRRRFRLLNRYLIAPSLSGTAESGAEARGEALTRVAADLGRMVPHLRLSQAVGYRVRRNYGYLLTVVVVAWGLKLEVHPTPASSVAEWASRAAIGNFPGGAVVGALAILLVILLVLAVRAPSEQMLGWADIPSPLERWVTRSQAWGRDIARRRPPDPEDS
ncbi:MAG: DUF2270 domain-containing protein [Gemmatimonadota bacterium]